ncbi:helix-turn-helix domain-containing protein [Nocardioides sp.]|uniref:helix-turn-helix transcriptional regulator n=1 Tax=Nocardioides sp. TaxID=35761 RepID=UPI0025DB2879|nr:helix-turn-helix domain-containing protein [Nocardioides sp.]
MSQDFEAAVSGVGALAEPARRALYLYAAAQPEPVSREQAAAACELPLHSAKFHLDRLVEEGLLEVEYRRLSGRTGPGAGRPSKLYRRSDREVSVSLPARQYDLVGDVLAAAIDESTRAGVPVQRAVVSVAGERGRAIGEAAQVGAGGELERAAEALAAQGYEPHRRDDTLCLSNCPFDRLARDHVELVCGMNLGLVGGVLEGLGCESLDAALEPEQGLCCVKVRPR